MPLPAPLKLEGCLSILFNRHMTGCVKIKGRIPYQILFFRRLWKEARF